MSQLQRDRRPGGPATRESVLREPDAARAGPAATLRSARPSLTAAARVHARRHSVQRRYRSVALGRTPTGTGPGTRALPARGLHGPADRWRIGDVLLWSRGTEMSAAAAVLACRSTAPATVASSAPPATATPASASVDGAPVGDPAPTPAVTIAVVVGRRR